MEKINYTLFTDAFDTILHLKREVEYELVKRMEDWELKFEPIELLSPPRGFTDIHSIKSVAHIGIETHYYDTLGNSFTMFDFSAEDFVSLIYRILKSLDE